jgi:ribosomal protein S18 acetylase RimI-like enzyme
MLTSTPSGGKFVKIFVHEMYVVLLGLGIAEIVFRKVPEHLSEPPLEAAGHIAAAFLVIGVMLRYWWDWSEYLESDVEVNGLEFFIDFATLINLELMFAYYGLPVVLAGLFLTLGVCDFLWVLNQATRLRARGRFVQRGRWLTEKLLAIAAYAIALVLLWLLSDYLPRIVVIALLAVNFFFVVRRIGFRQVRNVRNLSFRLAVPADAAAIAEVHNCNTGRDEPGAAVTGFLLEPTTEATIQQALADPKNRYYVASDSSGAVVGYVAISRSIPDDILKHVIWRSPGASDFVTLKRHRHITHAAVLPELAGRGVGQFLYEWLYAAHPHAFCSGFIATRPLRNERSLAFHRRQGFEGRGRFQADQFAGLDDYESLLMVKDVWTD